MAKHTAAATEEQAEEAEALALAAGAAAQLVVEGQAEGEPGHGLMGRYELVEGKVVGGRAVWEQRKGGGEEAYLFYASSAEKWYIGGKKSMEAGKAAGWVASAEGTEGPLTPMEATAGKWRASGAGGKGKWAEVPGLRVRRA